MSLGGIRVVPAVGRPDSCLMTSSTAPRPISCAGIETLVSGGEECSASWSGQTDDRDVLGHDAAPVAEQAQQRLDGGFILYDDPGGGGPLVEDARERARGGIESGLARPVHSTQAALARSAFEAVHGAGRETGVSAVDARALSDQRDVPMPEIREVIGTRRTGRLEIQVDAGQTVRAGGQPDQHGWQGRLAQHRDPPAVELDVHQDQGVGAAAGGDAAHACGPLVAGQQQDVLAVLACASGDGHHDLHDHRYIHVAA
jgi:hypothetical protein